MIETSEYIITSNNFRITVENNVAYFWKALGSGDDAGGAFIDFSVMNGNEWGLCGTISVSLLKDAFASLEPVCYRCEEISEYNRKNDLLNKLPDCKE